MLFQDNPSREKQTSQQVEPDDRAAVFISTKTRLLSEPAPIIQPGSGETSTEQMSDAKLLSRIKDIQNAVDDAAKPGSSVKKFDDAFIVEREYAPKQMNTWRRPVAPQVKKHSVLKVITYIFLILLVNVAIAGFYLGLFPEDRQQAADAFSASLSGNKNSLGKK